MDNPEAREPLSWAPQRPLVGIGWLLTAVAAAAAALTDDAPGQVLLALSTILLGLASLFGTLARPRLTADSSGITVRGLTGRRHWSWAQVTVRLRRTRRLGREVATIELDADPDLIVLGRLDLGADPVDVVDAIRALRI